MALIICEECSREISDRASSCPHCGCPVDNSSQDNKGLFNYNGKSYDVSVVLQYYNTGQLVKAIKEFREITGCELAEAKRVVENLSKTGIIQGEIVCPKCRSNQFDMVKRNWSLLTGFMTNKVDRVCRNCKHKF